MPHLGAARRPKRCHETSSGSFLESRCRSLRLRDVVQVCWFAGVLLAWDVNQQLERPKQ